MRVPQMVICQLSVPTVLSLGPELAAHISMNKNPADIASKIVGGGHKRTYLVGKLMHDIEDD